MIIKLALVFLVLGVGFGSAQPSTAEFNLFCRIWTEANDMMLEPDYVYDEEKDKEIVKEMQVLYNATTENMDDFRRMLWDTKDFFQEHPPPTHSESRKRAHKEIGQLIKEGERKIQENRELAKEVNKNIEAAKLSAAQGFYGDHVKKVPEKDGNLTKILNDTGSIFNHDSSPSQSCGNTGKAGKTLLNDFFCVCVGDGNSGSDGPCSPHILPSKKGNSNNNAGWKAMKYKTAGNIIHFNESIKVIEEVCKDTLDETSRKNILGLLDEYVGMIWNETTNSGAKGKKFFGHSGRQNKKEVKQCDGDGNNGAQETGNANICVDYSHNFKGDKYDIPWHTKFRNYFPLLHQAKKLEDQILKNRADLLLLKTKAWAAYNRENDDETSNLDDMNVSNLLDGTQLPSFSPLSYLSILL